MRHIPSDMHPFYEQLGEICYHLGRWVYIMDACDDLHNDCKRGNYNAVAARFGLTGRSITPDAQHAVMQTAGASLAAAAESFELMPSHGFTAVVRNVLYEGLPAVQNDVIFHEGKQLRKGVRR
jgi:hypothetical protein